MKNLTFILAVILFSSCVTSKVTARELESTPSLLNEEIQRWPHHHPKPHRHFPTHAKALPPLPASHFHPFHPSPAVVKCFSECRDAKICFANIIRAYITRKAAIGSDCCASVQKFNEDCVKSVFGSFHNSFFNGYVKLHCSTKVGSTASAPSPA